MTSNAAREKSELDLQAFGNAVEREEVGIPTGVREEEIPYTTIGLNRLQTGNSMLLIGGGEPG